MKGQALIGDALLDMTILGGRPLKSFWNSWDGPHRG
jgi:hypothetical protein